jgi:hypothetical protein
MKSSAKVPKNKMISNKMTEVVLFCCSYLETMKCSVKDIGVPRLFSRGGQKHTICLKNALKHTIFLQKKSKNILFWLAKGGGSKT